MLRFGGAYSYISKRSNDLNKVPHIKLPCAVAPFVGWIIHSWHEPVQGGITEPVEELDFAHIRQKQLTFLSSLMRKFDSKE